MTLANGNNGKRIRILLVDDQKMIREGLRALLDTEPDLEVVGTASSGQSAIEQAEKLKPDVMLVDMEMPDLDGVSTTEVICQKFPDIQVLVVSSYDDEEYVSKSFNVGAKGYLLKGTPAEELREAIRSVHRGYVQIGPGLFDKVLPAMPHKSQEDKEPTAVTVEAEKSPNEEKMAAAGFSKGKSLSALSVNPKPKTPAAKSQFEQAVVLRQSPRWSRAVVWTIMGVVTFGVAWAAIAKIEQVIPAQGQLKPQESVKEVQAPVNGVVKEVFVEEGEQVEKGELLVALDPTASESELKSLEEVRAALAQENSFYRALMNQPPGTDSLEKAIAQLEIPSEVATLARNRSALVAENQLYRAQVGGASGDSFTPEQRARLRASTAEMTSRAAAARLEAEQLQKQLQQNQAQLEDARAQLATARRDLAEIQSRNQLAIAQAQESLEIEQNILQDIEPLIAEGALARIQLERQRQEVNDRNATIVEQRANSKIEYNQQQQQIQTLQAEIEQLLQEEQRLRLDIAQAKEEIVNTASSSEKDVLDRIAGNEKSIAQIDSEITKLILENQKRIAELDGEISRTRLTLGYQELRAPVAGTVFDLQATEGFVPQPNGAEALLKIVPEDHLVAEVFVTNKDIGFVREDQNTDIRIESFPFSEFGDIKGKVISVGSDALPPDENHRFYRFPVKVGLNTQVLEARGDREIPLQSGMSVNVNIKVREKRTVLSLFTELFTDKVESLKEVR